MTDGGVVHALEALARATGLSALPSQFQAHGRARLEGGQCVIHLERAGDDGLLLALECPAGDTEAALRVLAAAHWRAEPPAGWLSGLQLGLRGPHHAGRWVLALRLDGSALAQWGLADAIAQLQEVALSLDRVAVPAARAGLSGLFLR